MLISFFYSEKHPPTQISQFVLIPPTHHPTKMNNFNRKKTARLKSIILFRSKAKKKLI